VFFLELNVFLVVMFFFSRLLKFTVVFLNSFSCVLPFASISVHQADYLQQTAGGGLLLLHTHFLLHSNILYTQYSHKEEDRRTLEARERINNKPSGESNPGGHSGERRTLTATPPLLPMAEAPLLFHY
jgi:hypothetical protein